MSAAGDLGKDLSYEEELSSENELSPMKVAGASSTIDMLKILANPDSPLHANADGDFTLRESPDTLPVGFDSTMRHTVTTSPTQEKMMYVLREAENDQLRSRIDQLERLVESNETWKTRHVAEVHSLKEQMEHLACENRRVKDDAEKTLKTLVLCKLELAECKTDTDQWKATAAFYHDENERFRAHFKKMNISIPAVRPSSEAFVGSRMKQSCQQRNM